MKPAISVILLTTLIGAGQGLFLAQFGAQLLVLLALLPATGNLAEFTAGGVISLMLLVSGLLASFFHLGHPERAWRAAAMWRTSWLSREVIALPTAMAAILAYTLAIYVFPESIALTLANGTAIALSRKDGINAVSVVPRKRCCYWRAASIIISIWTSLPTIPMP